MPVQAVSNVFHHDKKPGNEDEPHQQHRKHGHFLGLGHGEQHHCCNRDRHAKNEGAQLKTRIHPHEAHRARCDGMAVFISVGKHPNKLRYAIALFRKLHRLAVDEIALFELMCKKPVEIGEMRTSGKPECHESREEHRQHAHVVRPGAVVEAGNDLADGSDSVREGKYRIHRLEKARGHFDRVQPGGGGDLDEHQNHAQPHAHVLEGARKGVLNAQIRKRSSNSRQEEQRRVHSLHADCQTPCNAHNRLQGRHQSKEQPTAEIALPRFDTRNAFTIHLFAHDHHQHESPYPKRKIDEERRHSRPVRIDWIELLCRDGRGGHHEIRYCVRIYLSAEKRLKGARGCKSLDVGCGAFEVFLEPYEQIIGLRESVGRKIERRFKLVEGG